MSGPIRCRVVVHGDVQGVGFRETTRRTAERTGVVGWVRNLPDGSVEAVCEGEPGAVDEIVAYCHVGPPDARVERVEALDEPVEGLRGFAVRSTPPRE